jgi:hypothetical protein
MSVAVVVTLLSVAVSMLVAVAVRVSTASLPVPAAAAETTASTALHSLGVASRGSATGSRVSLRRSLENSQLGVTLFAESLELAALLVEQGDVVVAVAVGFVASGDGVVAEFAGVVEGGSERFDFNLVFGGFLFSVSGLVLLMLFVGKGGRMGWCGG